MYHLATVTPLVRRIPIPLSRDQFMLLMAAINEIFLGIDIYLAHNISGTIVFREWIPIIFGPVAGVLLLIAGVIAIKQRPLATVIATVVLLSSIVVGLLGAYFHVVRAALPSAASVSDQVTTRLLIWGPPVLGPLMFALVGLLGISAAWIETPPDSGRLRLLGGRHLQLPLSKTRAYFLMVGVGTLVTVISSVLDHARTDFENPYLWIPVVTGVFGAMAGVALGFIDRPTRADLITYTAAMVLLLATGVIGALLHIDDNLTTRGTFVVERFIRGAPFLAPLLFANMGGLGLLVLLDPRSEIERQEG